MQAPQQEGLRLAIAVYGLELVRSFLAKCESPRLSTDRSPCCRPTSGWQVTWAGYGEIKV
jgi:hypothetical protein